MDRIQTRGVSKVEEANVRGKGDDDERKICRKKIKQAATPRSVREWISSEERARSPDRGSSPPGQVCHPRDTRKRRTTARNDRSSESDGNVLGQTRGARVRNTRREPMGVSLFFSFISARSSFRSAWTFLSRVTGRLLIAREPSAENQKTALFRNQKWGRVGESRDGLNNSRADFKELGCDVKTSITLGG